MFDNMTKRERIMAMAVGAMAPIALLFWGITSIGGGLQKRTDEINRLQSQVTQLGTQENNARLAMARLGNYRSESLPSSPSAEVVSSNFRTFLDKLAGEYGLHLPTVTVAKINDLQAVMDDNKKQLAMQTYKYEVKGAGTPRQITAFLYRLNEAKVLQRSTLTLKPQKDKGDRGKINGRWAMDLNVEVASLPDAERDGEFKDETRPFSDRSLEDYHSVVSRRNMFGPVNEEPKFKSNGSAEFEPGERMTVALEVEESDRGLEFFDEEKYQFSIEDTNIEGLEIVQDEAGSREAELKLPEGLAEGEYTATVKTRDSGWPYMEATKEISITVSEAEEVVIADVKPRRIARDTYLRVIKTTNGVKRVWIYNPEWDKLKLAVGETFDLDNLKWTVKSINRPFVTFTRGDETLTFKMEGNLDSPINGDEEGEKVSKR